MKGVGMEMGQIGVTKQRRKRKRGKVEKSRLRISALRRTRERKPVVVLIYEPRPMLLLGGCLCWVAEGESSEKLAALKSSWQP